ncbi:hypothetical protein Pcinc_042244 [Petrolisthes cinctipes]|uniref:Uncharacterized protein n=1 Tax=Petrolisthes cinctipes TaxID=88211 RepID=A0AAE1BIP9_PETCI|nr:hypothetical protein Pcinc_042244 [Petrolisthes cinctipes]
MQGSLSQPAVGAFSGQAELLTFPVLLTQSPCGSGLLLAPPSQSPCEYTIHPPNPLLSVRGELRACVSRRRVLNLLHTRCSREVKVWWLLQGSDMMDLGVGVHGGGRQACRKEGQT